MRTPFFGPEGRRAIDGEICGRIEELTGSRPVCGFADMLDMGDAVGNSDRKSGFREGDRQEWLLRLSAKRGMMWSTDPVPVGGAGSVAFMLSIGFGNGSPLPQPTGAWQVFVNDKPAVRIRNVGHSYLWRGEHCSFAFAANRQESAPPYCGMTLSSIVTNESRAAFGPALLQAPSSWVEPGQPARIRVEPAAYAESTQWLQISPCASMLHAADVWAAVDLLSGDRWPGVGDYKLFFGDIHTHSGQVMDDLTNRGCGMLSRVDNYEYAREPGGLDFYALTDHEWQIDPARINDYLGLADTHNEDGRFVCLPAFEFTNLLYGHRNAYFRDSGGTVVNTARGWGHPSLDPVNCLTPRELWDALEQTGVPFITVPHHSSATSHPLNLDFHDPRYDRLFEVYSSWGSSEYYGDFPRGVSDRFRTGDFHDTMRRGLRYGLIASSDGHDGHPGNAQSPLVKHHHLFHFCGSGWAAVLATELTRGGVFDALYARRCYATTGVPIVLDVTICGALMGSEIPALPAGRVPEMRVRCIGASALDHVRIVKNGRVAHTVPCHGQRSVEIEWQDPGYRPGSSAGYYVRVVQVDRESAWSSPVWVG